MDLLVPLGAPAPWGPGKAAGAGFPARDYAKVRRRLEKRRPTPAGCRGPGALRRCRTIPRRRKTFLM
ncbi:MAG: hypothetical protein AB1491_01630 [Thermodesulfobacteriota bacterium]